MTTDRDDRGSSPAAAGDG